MILEAEHRKVEEHELVNPHLRAETSPQPTRLNRLYMKTMQGNICPALTNASK